MTWSAPPSLPSQPHISLVCVFGSPRGSPVPTHSNLWQTSWLWLHHRNMAANFCCTVQREGSLILISECLYVDYQDMHDPSSERRQPCWRSELGMKVLLPCNLSHLLWHHLITLLTAAYLHPLPSAALHQPTPLPASLCVPWSAHSPHRSLLRWLSPSYLCVASATTHVTVYSCSRSTHCTDTLQLQWQRWRVAETYWL